MSHFPLQVHVMLIDRMNFLGWETAMGGLYDIEKADRHFLKLFQHDRDFLYQLAATQPFGVVCDSFHAQYPRAFVIELQGHRSEMQLEHGQVISGLVQNTLQSFWFLTPAFMRTSFVTKNGAQFRHIQVLPGSLYQALVDGIEHCATGKKQVAAIFDLINRSWGRATGSI